MSSSFVEYRLPETVLVIKGTKVVRTDSALREGQKSRVTVRTQSQVTLETEAEETVLVARVAHGTFRDTSVSLDLTEDRRLAAASSETDGQAAKVVLGVVSGAAAAVGLATGLFPLAAGVAGVVGASALRDLALMDEIRRGALEAPDMPTVETKETLKDQIRLAARRISEEAVQIADLYIDERQEEALQRQRISNRVTSLLGDLTRALWDVEQADGEDAAMKLAARRVRLCQAALEVARAELARMDAVFEAWHAGKVKEDMIHVPLRMPLRKVLEAVRDNPPAADADMSEALTVLRKLGLWLTATHLDARVGPGSDASWESTENWCMEAGSKPHEPLRSACGVVLRQPRRLTLELYQRYDGAYPTSYEEGDLPPDLHLDEWRLVESRRCRVVDDECRHEFVPFRTSWWGRKTVGLELWPDGGLKKYTSTGVSQAAAIAGMAAEVPSKIAGGLKDSASILEQVDTLQGRRDEGAQQLAGLKRLVETKTWELALAGLNATTGQVEELERLKQRLAILQAQADIDELLTEGA